MKGPFTSAAGVYNIYMGKQTITTQAHAHFPKHAFLIHTHWALFHRAHGPEP